MHDSWDGHRRESGGSHSACSAPSSDSASSDVSHSIQVTSHARIHSLTGSTSPIVTSVGRTVVLLVGAIPRYSQTFRRKEERERSAPVFKWFFHRRPWSPSP